MIYVSQIDTRGSRLVRRRYHPTIAKWSWVEKNISRTCRRRERKEQIDQNNHDKLYRDIFQRLIFVSLVTLRQLLNDRLNYLFILRFCCISIYHLSFQSTFSYSLLLAFAISMPIFSLPGARSSARSIRHDYTDWPLESQQLLRTAF